MTHTKADIWTPTEEWLVKLGFIRLNGTKWIWGEGRDPISVVYDPERTSWTMYNEGDFRQEMKLLIGGSDDLDMAVGFVRALI